MADNINVTPGIAGKTVRAFEIGGLLYQGIIITDPTTGVPIDWAADVLVVGKGVAGTPAGGVLSVQGVAGGTPLPVSGTFSSAGPTADDATATGFPVQVAGKYTAAMPTYADGDTAQLRLTAKGNLIIGGMTADDAAAPVAADSYPVPVGGKYNATLPAYTDGDRTQAQFTANGHLLVAGFSADDAAAVGNPLPVGGKYNAALPNYTDGDRTQLQFLARGQLAVTLLGSSGTTLTSGAGASDANAIGTGISAFSFGAQWSGATWERARSISGSFGSPIGVAATEQAGSPFAHLTTTTLVKTGAGILHKVVVNTLSAGSISIYDNVSGTGSPIAIINGGVERSINYDLAFATGLNVVVTGTPDVTVVYR